MWFGADRLLDDFLLIPDYLLANKDGQDYRSNKHGFDMQISCLHSQSDFLLRCYSRAFTLVVDSAPQPHAFVVNFHHHLGEMPPTGRLERRFAA
jgi:hypothetical protein